jgi:flagellar hook-associated protein 3 FlgL
MAVSSVNLARISNNLRAYNLLEALRRNQVGMFRVQTSMSTGYRFQQPSDDPVRAGSANELTRQLDWMNQIQGNLDKVNAALNETDSAMSDAVDLVSQAHTLVLQAVGDTTTQDERRALVPVAQSIIDQLITLGNRKYLGTYLFAGHQATAPFELTGDGVVYSGDDQRMRTLVDTDRSEDAFTVSGQEFFGAVSAEIRGSVDLDPGLTTDTLVSDLRGGVGRGVELGRIQVSAGGAPTEIDLTGAATVGDVIDKLNAALPTGVRATLGPRGLTIGRATPGGAPISITEVAGGCTAADLGILGTFNGNVGADLDPRLTLRTRLTDINAGSGFNLAGGFTIRNGERSATIQPDQCQTVEELLNAVNHADADVVARIGDDGRTLEIRSRVSGATLRIEENGGQAATALGLRSLAGATPLAALNDGLGIETVAGADLRITTADGRTADIDLDGARTVQDVLDRLNAAAGGAYTAGLVATGNGLLIHDNTAGGGTLSVTALNGSLAAHRLGLDGTASNGELVGRDVNPVRVDGPFTALMDLRLGLATDDRGALQAAGARFDRVMQQMRQVQGQMASRAQAMSQRRDRVETEATATKALLSDVRDVDIADAAVRFQQFQTALQANMATAARVMNLSLLDYLR